MTTVPDEWLRPLVAQAVRSALGDLRPGASPAPLAPGGATAPSAPAGPFPTPAPGSSPAGRDGTPAAGGRPVERVRLADDRDLDAFVRRIVALCANPRTRQQLVSGQLRFSLDGVPAGAAARPRPGNAHRVERGAVTERVVTEAARRGQDLQLGRKAVLTPLARDRARALDVRIEKEN